MSNSTVKVLDVPLSRFDMDESLAYTVECVKNRRGGYICFANVHTVTEAHRDLSVRKAMTESLLAVADGLPLVWVSRMKSKRIGSRVCGPDFMARFLVENPKIRFGFIGGSPGQAEGLSVRFGVKAPCYSPPVRPFSAEAVAEDWRKFLGSAGTAPQVVWVGLGAPKQELWMNVASRIAPDTLFFGVGAAFDFLTEKKKRAPLWMQNAGLEWLFRLLSEPRRLWRRYFETNLLFLWYLAVDLFKTKESNVA